MKPQAMTSMSPLLPLDSTPPFPASPDAPDIFDSEDETRVGVTRQSHGHALVYICTYSRNASRLISTNVTQTHLTLCSTSHETSPVTASVADGALDFGYTPLIVSWLA